MKVSLNLVKFINSHYKCGTDPYSYGVDEIIKRIGAQLGAVEDVVFFGKRYDGIVVAKVVDCIPHNNSDHLSVCLIDDGRAVDGVDRNSEGFVQVVCGAPNVHEGLAGVAMSKGNHLSGAGEIRTAESRSIGEINRDIHGGIRAQGAGQRKGDGAGIFSDGIG
jgi:hypothetical protein